METQTQLHGLGIMEAGDMLKVQRRRSADSVLPAPQDCRHPRRSSLPERIVATAALRAAQLASLEHSTRVYVPGAVAPGPSPLACMGLGLGMSMSMSMCMCMCVVS